MTDRELLEEILARMTKTEAALEKLQKQQTRTAATLEGFVLPAIQKLAEGHELILERIDEKITDRTERIQEQVDVLNVVVKYHSEDINKLKKAQ